MKNINEIVGKYLNEDLSEARFKAPQSFTVKKAFRQGDMNMPAGEYMLQKEVYGKYLYQQGYSSTVSLGEIDLKQLFQSKKIS